MFTEVKYLVLWVVMLLYIVYCQLQSSWAYIILHHVQIRCWEIRSNMFGEYWHSELPIPIIVSTCWSAKLRPRKTDHRCCSLLLVHLSFLWWSILETLWNYSIQKTPPKGTWPSKRPKNSKTTSSALVDDHRTYWDRKSETSNTWWVRRSNKPSLLRS